MAYPGRKGRLTKPPSLNNLPTLRPTGPTQLSMLETELEALDNQLANTKKMKALQITVIQTKSLLKRLGKQRLKRVTNEKSPDQVNKLREETEKELADCKGRLAKRQAEYSGVLAKRKEWRIRRFQITKRISTLKSLENVQETLGNPTRQVSTVPDPHRRSMPPNSGHSNPYDPPHMAPSQPFSRHSNGVAAHDSSTYVGGQPNPPLDSQAHFHQGTGNAIPMGVGYPWLSGTPMPQQGLMQQGPLLPPQTVNGQNTYMQPNAVTYAPNARMQQLWMAGYGPTGGYDPRTLPPNDCADYSHFGPFY